MIIKCGVCESVIDDSVFHYRWQAMCTHCGHTPTREERRDATIREPGWNGCVFPRWKAARKFGRLVAVPTKHTRRARDTRKQRKRRVAKRKKERWGGHHKTGRIP